MPCVLLAVYLILLVTRLPQIIGWENADSDIASAFTLTDAISHGHTGEVVLSTQGSWIPLLWGLLTHGLRFHRLLWELSPASLTSAAALLIAWPVSQVASRKAAWMTVGLIVAASPVALVTFTSAFSHNTTIPGAALLDAYLVWLSVRERARRAVLPSIPLLSVVVGALLASDNLLAVVGLVPFLAASLLLYRKRRDPRELLPPVAVTAGAIVVSAAVSHIARSLRFVTTTPPLRLTRTLEGTHLKWLVQGLLRMGNGLVLPPQGGLRNSLTVAAAITTIAAVLATIRIAGRSLSGSTNTSPKRARFLHVTFWGISALCAAAAYVFTNVAVEPSDRYIIIAVPAVAALVPLLATSRRSAWALALGACVFVTASIVSLAAGDERFQLYGATDVRQAAAIERLVQSQHLTVGYAGYWDAASLDWSTHSRLRVYPLIDLGGQTEPAPLARVASWYTPRPRTPSYLLLAPGDKDFPNRLPRHLPRPARYFRLGQVTVAVYPYDIARYFHAPVN